VKTIARILGFICLFFLVKGVAAQTLRTETGTPWTGARGVTLSVQELMDLQAQSAETNGPRIPREHEIELDRRNNPNSPLTDRWPVGAQERDGAPGGGNQTYATQTIGTSFLAANSSVSAFVPPDCNGDVGPTQILTVANGRVRVYSKAGVLGGLNVTTDVFFNSVRNSSSVSDPHVRYDRLTQRWFVVAINVASTNNRVLIAVSSGPTITNTSSFTFFYFQFNLVSPAGDAGKFLDYPTLGVDASALYIGGVRFNPNVFDGCPVFVVRKSSVLGAGPIVATAFRTAGGTSTGIYVPQGVHNDDPAATEGYFIGTDAGVYGAINVIRIGTPGGTPTMTALPAITIPLNSNPQLQVHQGAAANRRLDALDDRLFAAHIMQNKLTGASSLWTCHTSRANSSGVSSGTQNRNVTRWYQLTNLTTTPALAQSGTLYDNAATNPRGFWNGSIAMTGQGHAVLGCTSAGAAARADVAVAGRYSSDASGTLQTFNLATNSSTTYVAQATDGQRWGDYSQTVVDPNDNITAWTFQEYCDAANSWGLRVVQLKAPAPPPTASLNALPTVGNLASVTVNVIANSTPNNTAFFDPGADAGGPGWANHITATATGGIAVNGATFISPTQVNLDLNTTGVSAGTYTITIINPDGQTTTIPITISSTLPIELISFSARATENFCELDWVTASETNNDYFTIERSATGEEFEAVAKVKGAGTTTTLENYEYRDMQPHEGLSYYRLRQTDYDGTSTVSDIIPVDLKRSKFELTGISPDWNRQLVHVYFSDKNDQTLDYVIVDQLGKTVLNGRIQSNRGSNALRIDASSLAKGMYYFNIGTGEKGLSGKFYY